MYEYPFLGRRHISRTCVFSFKYEINRSIANASAHDQGCNRSCGCLYAFAHSQGCRQSCVAASMCVPHDSALQALTPHASFPSSSHVPFPDAPLTSSPHVSFPSSAEGNTPGTVSIAVEQPLYVWLIQYQATRE